MGGAGGGCLINVRSCTVAFAASVHATSLIPLLQASHRCDFSCCPLLCCSGCGWTLPSPCPCASASPQASALATGGRCSFRLSHSSQASVWQASTACFPPWTMAGQTSGRFATCSTVAACSEAKRPSPLPLPTLSTCSAVAVSGVFDAITAALHLQRACALGERMQLPALGLSTARAGRVS